MCMAIPGKVLNLEKDQALVDFQGTKMSVKTDILLPKKGDWVLVFSGQVMETITEARAREILDTAFKERK
jgi:hydrogenase expression/formation protein HypC